MALTGQWKCGISACTPGVFTVGLRQSAVPLFAM